MGHSAGAQLAALVCTDDRYLKAEGLSLSIIKGCVPVDGDTYDVPLQIKTVEQRRADIYRRKFGDEDSQKDLSPVTHVAKGKDIPPFLILHVADHPETKGAVAATGRRRSQDAGVSAKAYPAEGKNHSDDQFRPGAARRQADPGVVRVSRCGARSGPGPKGGRGLCHEGHHLLPANAGATAASHSAAASRPHRRPCQAANRRLVPLPLRCRGRGVSTGQRASGSRMRTWLPSSTTPGMKFTSCLPTAFPPALPSWTGASSDEVELVQFGLTPEFIGQGLGKWFLQWTIDRAWSYEPTRFWLHTCTKDHPAALPNYLKAGFTIYKETVKDEL